jgi:hypothetical protein
MAIVIRIVSADGKKAVMKSLPGLPAHLKVPAGARVEIVEDGRTISLAQYVNEHANQKDPDDVLDTAKVVLDPADSWESAESWLDSLAAPRSSDKDSWFSTAKDERGAHVAGLGVDGLLIGGALAAGVGFGVYELTRGGKAKDTVAPVAPTGLDLAADDDSGTSSTDNITNKTTGLTITGTAEAGSTVELFDGTASLGTLVAGANGSFTKDLDLAAGVHQITAKATDNAGNVSAASTALAILVKPTAPDAPTGLDLAADDDTGSSNSDNITSKTSALTITGTGEVGAQVELFDGATSLGTATIGSGGTFTKDISLATGTHSITAKATDLAGNVGAASDPLEITIDPAATFTLDLATEDDTGSSSTDNLTNKTSGLTITGTTTANASVELFDGTTSLGTVTSGADGKFTKDISLAEGAHAVTAKVAGGAASSDPLTITVDTTPPTTLSAPDLAAADDTGISSTDNITNKTTGLTIQGVVATISTLEMFVDGVSVGTINTAGNGSFTKDLDLSEGTHAITLKGIDAAGNVGDASAALSITVDTTAPASPSALDLAAEDDNGASNSDNTTSVTSGLTISGNAEAGSTVELFDGATSLGTVTVGSNGLFTKDISLAVGSHSITAKDTDVAGNVGSASTALAITIVAAQSKAVPETVHDDSSAALLSALSSAGDGIDHTSLFDSSGGFG